MRRDQKKKLFLIVTLSIIYVLIAINFHKIRFAISILRLYSQDKKIESPVGDIAKNKPHVDNPLENILGSVDVVDKVGEAGDIVPTPVDNSVDNTENPPDKIEIPDKPAEPIKPVDPVKPVEPIENKKSYVEIIGKYNLMFEDLRTEFESQLDALIKQGIHEYSKGGMSSSKLANKYLTVGSDLERSSDAKFNKILKEMEKELKANDHSASIAKEIKGYYVSFKDAKKTDLIDRGMKHVK